MEVGAGEDVSRKQNKARTAGNGSRDRRADQTDVRTRDKEGVSV